MKAEACSCNTVFEIHRTIPSLFTLTSQLIEIGYMQSGKILELEYEVLQDSIIVYLSVETVFKQYFTNTSVYT